MECVASTRHSTRSIGGDHLMIWRASRWHCVRLTNCPLRTLTRVTACWVKRVTRFDSK